MSSRQHQYITLAAILALVVVMTDTAKTGGNVFDDQRNFAGSVFSAKSPCPVNEFRVFESVNPVPSLINPFEDDFISIHCQVKVQKKGENVLGAKGIADTNLIVLDNLTGKIETFDLGARTFRTDRNGLDDFDFDIPTELFADGFESGDVSAWSSTRSDFTNKKKADKARVSCNSSSSKNNLR